MNIYNTELTVKAAFRYLMGFRESHCLRGNYPFVLVAAGKALKKLGSRYTFWLCILFSRKDMKSSVTFLAIAYFHRKERT